MPFRRCPCGYNPQSYSEKSIMPTELTIPRTTFYFSKWSSNYLKAQPKSFTEEPEKSSEEDVRRVNRNIY